MSILPKHLKFEQLADLAEGRLDDAVGAETQAHLDECERCAASLSRLQQTIGLMRADNSVDAPRDVLSFAVNLFQARPAKHRAVRRVLALLNFDSVQQTPAFGVRSGAQAARQLLYSAGENDIDLRVTQSGEAWVVSGQVLGECAGGEVELTGESGEANASLNEQCEFSLAPLPTGSYTLRLRLTDAEIEVPEFQLKA
ncbi:MAG: hypothetical protein WCB68_08940 [Pyrinomonadaceae bacterium]